MIKQTTIDEIFNTVQIHDIVSDFVNLKKRGSNFLGLCPFHNEKTPSFTVSPSKNIYKCFGCGRGGNSVQFVMEHEQLNYPEALRYLAEKYSIEIEEEQLDPDAIEKEGFDPVQIKMLLPAKIPQLLPFAFASAADCMVMTDDHDLHL